MKRPDFTVGDYVRYDERYHCVSKVNAIKYNKAMQCYEATLNNDKDYFTEKLTKVDFNTKTEFKDRWISLFKKQGWKYKVLEDGRVMVIASLLHKKLTFFIEDHKMRLMFWTRDVRSKKPTPGPRFNIRINKLGKIQINTTRGAGFVDNTLYNMPKLLQAFQTLFVAKQKGKGPEWIKDPEWQGFRTKNIIHISSPKNKRKLDIIFNMFFGLNHIPYEYSFTKDSTNFVEFIWKNKYPGLKNTNQNPGLYVSNNFIKKKFLDPDMNDNKLLKYLFKSKGKKTKKLFYSIVDSGFPFVLFKYLRTRLNKGQLINVLESFINKKVTVGHIPPHNLPLLKLLDGYSNIRVYHLFMTLEGSVQHTIFDALRQYERYKDDVILPESPKNFIELHDDISIQYRRLKTPNYTFDNVKEDLKNVHGKEITVNDKTYKIIVPKDRYELIAWGTKMNNCIASYHDRFHNQQCDLLALESKDGLEANIEISNGRLRQFYGNHNSRLDDEFKVPFIELFKEHKLLAENHPFTNNNRLDRI